MSLSLSRLLIAMLICCQFMWFSHCIEGDGLSATDSIKIDDIDFVVSVTTTTASTTTATASVAEPIPVTSSPQDADSLDATVSATGSTTTAATSPAATTPTPVKDGSFDDDSNNHPLFMDIRPVNRTDSLYRIKNAPFVHYRFKYDSKSDRSQIGIIGPDAHKYFPESIDVVPSKLVTSKDRSKPAFKVKNVPVIDKNVLFMHGLVALQELIHQYDNLTDFMNSIENISDRKRAELQEMRDLLHRDIDEHTKLSLEAAQLELELVRQQQEMSDEKAAQEKQLMEKQLELEREVMEYEAQLVRERMQKQEELENRNAQFAMQLERELTEKKEALARESEQSLQQQEQEQTEQLQQKRLEFEKEKIRAELAGKAQQEQAAHELELERIKMQSQLDTERMITGIRAVSLQLTAIVKDVLAKPKQVAMFAGIILLLIVMYYFIRESTKLLRQFIQSRLGRPSLVRETSYHWSFLPNSLAALLVPREPMSAGRKMLEEQFKDVVLSDTDKKRVLNLALATRNTKQSGAPFRHVLLHGVPGTGKTLIAKRLASVSGMDYAIMSGGDVAPLGDEAVSQLHGLFRWAQKSRRGLLVFIDEAEAFLSSRSSTGGTLASDSGGGGSEVHVRNALNALLYQTGTPSQNFMLVLATNRPEDLDSAVLDRVDISINIGLPALPQRIDLVKLYLRIYVQDVAAAASQRLNWKQKIGLQRRSPPCLVDADCVDKDTISRIAAATDGFSGREIAKMFIAAQYAMFLTEDGTLSKQLLFETVRLKLEDHRMKSNAFKAVAATDAAAGGDELMSLESSVTYANTSATAASDKSKSKKRSKDNGSMGLSCQ